MLHHYEGFASKESPAVGVINGHSEATASIQALPFLFSSCGSTTSSHFGDIGAWKMAQVPLQLADGAGAAITDRNAIGVYNKVAPDTVLALNQAGGPIFLSDAFVGANVDAQYAIAIGAAIAPKAIVAEFPNYVAAVANAVPPILA